MDRKIKQVGYTALYTDTEEHTLEPTHLKIRCLIGSNETIANMPSWAFREAQA